MKIFIQKYTHVRGIFKRFKSLGGSIIALANYWCSIKDLDYQNTLYCMLPSNTSLLSVQITEAFLSLELPEAVV
jgi:hypothetical protein